MSLNRSPTLGRGLDALFGHNDIKAKDVVQGDLYYIDLNKIKGDINQPRKKFSPQELDELSQSIRQKGVLQPIIVKPIEQGYHTIIAGERRWRAAKLAGLKEIPALVKSWNDNEIFEISLIENIQREDLTLLEEAAGYQRLVDVHGYTQEKVSQIIKKSRSYIANSIRLLTLPEKIQNYINSGALTMSHARTLINHPHAEQLADEIIAKGLNVRHTEKVSKQRSSSGKLKEINPDILQIQHQLESITNLKVTLSCHNGRGQLKINFNSLKELDRLVEKLNNHN